MRELRALAGAAVALVPAQLAVRLLPFRWLATAVGGLGALPSDPVRPEPRAVGGGRVVSHVVRCLPWHSTCLVRALAARFVLTRLGVYLGVTKENGAIQAHARLPAGGGVCRGREAPDYVPIAVTTAERTG